MKIQLDIKESSAEIFYLLFREVWREAGRREMPEWIHVHPDDKEFWTNYMRKIMQASIRGKV